MGLARYVSATNGAMCMDGTPPVYWVNYNPSKPNKWLLSLEGGGYCASFNSSYNPSWTYNCYSFMTYTPTGTSNEATLNANGYTVPYWNFSSELGNYFSQDTSTNPMFADWNMVYLHYCDSGAWLSNLDNSVTSTGEHEATMYLKGYQNLEAILADLNENYDLDSATDIVLAGQSAGAVAAYAYLDFVASKYSVANVVGMPDSGFFLQLNYEPCNYADQFVWMYENMNIEPVLNAGCVAAYNLAGGNASDCMFAQNMIPYILTPFFALQSAFDSSQYGYILCLSVTEDPTNETAIYAYSEILRETYYSSGMGTVRNSGLLGNCPRHYYYYNFSTSPPILIDEWNGIGAYSTAGSEWNPTGSMTTQQQAFSTWFENAYTVGLNLQQTPVSSSAPYLNFSYCSNAFPQSTSMGDGSSNDSGLSVGAIALITVAAILVGFVAGTFTVTLILRKIRSGASEEGITLTTIPKSNTV